MKIKPEKKQFKLEPAAIDEISEDLQEFLQAIGTQKKNLLAARLAIEDILLDFMEKFGNDADLIYTENKFLGKPYITINVKGEEFNPLEKDDEGEFGNWSSSLIASSDFTPVYSYEKGTNTITMRFSKKSMNPIFLLVIAIVSAFLVSLIRFALPKATMDYILTDIINPLNEAFLGLMGTFEVPLIFLSITCGIMGIGDSSIFGKIGRKMILRFIGLVLAVTTVSGLIFGLLFLRINNDAGAEYNISGGFKMVLDIIPHGILEPFTSGNTMQAAFVAIVFGVTLVVLGKNVKSIQNIANESHMIITHLTGLVSKILPLFIFIIMLNIIWSGNIGVYLKMWRLLASFIGMVILTFTFFLLRVSYKEKVKAKILLKKMLPTFLIGLGTASSTALDGESSECMSRKMGINKKFVEFGQPAGSVVFMPTTSISFIACAVFMADYYKTDISVMWIIIAFIVCTFVSVATPPVAGGGMAAYSIIFTQLGLPLEAVAAVVSLDILFDLVATAFDSVFLQLELITQADKNNMLDHEKLRADIA